MNPHLFLRLNPYLHNSLTQTHESRAGPSFCASNATHCQCHTALPHTYSQVRNKHTVWHTHTCTHTQTHTQICTQCHTHKHTPQFNTHSVTYTRWHVHKLNHWHSYTQLFNPNTPTQELRLMHTYYILNKHKYIHTHTPACTQAHAPSVRMSLIRLKYVHPCMLQKKSLEYNQPLSKKR
jgi:hypothetical protein